MADIQRVSDLYGKVLGEVSKAIVGKEDTIRSLMVSLLAGGHVLIEGLPGTAKTKLAKSFAEAIGGRFSRIQFTPDMMPADITGFYLYSPVGESRFVDGPIFANIVLADELNRTTPRTQSALLEAMQEYQVTIERHTHPLERPFIVIATQMFAGSEGTYPLTDVQADRFLLRVLSQYPSVEAEKEVISNIDRIDEPQIQVVGALDEIMALHDIVREVHVAPEIVDYVVAVLDGLRADSDVAAGPSTRGGIALFKCARALAAIEGRGFVIPDDIKFLAHPALDHRLAVTPEAEMDEITPEMIVDRVVENTPVPKIKI